MRKTSAILLVSALLCGMTYASPKYVILTTTNVATNSTAVRTDYTRQLSGYLDSICLYRTRTNEITVEVGTSANQGLGANTNKVLISVTITGSNCFYSPRLAPHNVAGLAYTNDTVRFPFCGNSVYLKAYNAVTVGCDISAQIIYDEQ